MSNFQKKLDESRRILKQDREIERKTGVKSNYIIRLENMLRGSK